MLSLVGSLQPDPFSPAHVPQPAALSAAPADVSDDEEDEGVEAEEKEASGSDDEEDENAPVYRCMECFGVDLMCKNCCVNCHSEY